MKVERALISVSDKSGILEFAKELAGLGVEILSTGGTFKLLSENGIDVVEIENFTGFPEMLNGRVKTLHPKVHGGILALRDNEEHVEAMSQNDIKKIDLVVVNLYPFEKTVSKKNVEVSEAIENIDIGGPTMLRSAAKNYNWVASVVDPEDYPLIISEIKQNGYISDDYRFTLAKKVFNHTARYDSLISNYLGNMDRDFPYQINLNFLEKQSLRYGENPHQKAFFYKEYKESDSCNVSNLKQLHGKELSFNNIIDLSSAIDICREFNDKTFCCILKHTNPCGAAVGETSSDAFENAWSTDPVSAFGSIIGFTKEVDSKTAEEINKYFVEIVTAPSFTDEALEILKKKKNIRIMVMTKPLVPYNPELDIKRVCGGVLIQEKDWIETDINSLEVVTDKKPQDGVLEELLFGWKLCKHIKSNAICYFNSKKLLGVGAGQMSRVDSATIGAEKSNFPLEGCYLASDAFFPFRDGIDAAAKKGVRAIIQPGGSVRDQEVIDACNEHGIVMVFTGNRHFKH